MFQTTNQIKLADIISVGELAVGLIHTEVPKVLMVNLDLAHLSCWQSPYFWYFSGIEILKSEWTHALVKSEGVHHRPFGDCKRKLWKSWSISHIKSY